MDNPVSLLDSEWFIIVYTSLILITILEFIAIFTWSKSFFDLGILVFQYSSKIRGIPQKVTEKQLNKFDDAEDLVRIKYKEKEEDVFMFREYASFFNKDLRQSSGGAVRGMLYIDHEDLNITIYGILNTQPVIFFVIMIGLSIQGFSFAIVLCILSFVFTLFGIRLQFNRYSSVARRVANICSTEV